MQKRGQAECPLCRAPTVLQANRCTSATRFPFDSPLMIAGVCDQTTSMPHCSVLCWIGSRRKQRKRTMRTKGRRLKSRRANWAYQTGSAKSCEVYAHRIFPLFGLRVHSALASVCAGGRTSPSQCETGVAACCGVSSSRRYRVKSITICSFIPGKISSNTMSLGLPANARNRSNRA